MWRSRMFWRLFGSYGGLLLAAIGLLGAVIVHRVEGHFLEQVASSLHTKAVLVREIVSEGSGGESLQERMVALRQEIAARITLIADDGLVQADTEEAPETMENHAERPEVRAAREGTFASTTRYSSTLSQPMMYAALRVEQRRPERNAVAFVRIAVPLDRIQQQLAWLRRVVWTAAALTGVGAMGLAFWLARRIAEPLQELTHSAERIAAGGHGHKVYVSSQDEIGDLAHTFNHMSERLADQFNRLEEDEQQLRAILGGMVEGVVALNADQRLLFANERAAHLLEFPLPSAVGRKFWEVVRKRPIQDIVQRVLTRTAPCWEEMSWNGTAVKNLAVHAAQLPGAPSRGVVLVLHDISELRRLERLRQEFVANVSHELKTPLAVISAHVETLLDGAVDDIEHRGAFLQQIADQAERLHTLILDLISLARIEAGTEAFTFETVTLAKAVAGCVARHRALAEGKSQRLEAIPGTAELAVWADEEAVGQILNNLVDNALKYTPNGGHIRIRWWQEDGQACLEVADNGIGIPDKDLPHIFERFYRVDKARSRELGGTGLGLSIVKHLVQAMHGNVRVSSRLSQGSTFVVQLPRPADA